MKIDKSVRESVQQQLKQRGFPDPIPEPTQPEWDGFREQLKTTHPDLYQELLPGLRYDRFPDPQTQQQRQARQRAGRARRKAALTQEMDELTGQVVTSRPKLLLLGGLALLGFAGLVAWGVGLSRPTPHPQKPAALAAAPAPAPLETVAPATPLPVPIPPSPKPAAKPLPKPLKPLPEAAPENWSPPAPLPPAPIPSTPQAIAVRQPLPQTQYVPPPPPPRLERSLFPPPAPPKPVAGFKPRAPAPSPGGFSLLAPLAPETPASTKANSQSGGFYLAPSSAATNSAPVTVGQFYQGQLASELILTEGGRMTAVVLSGSSVWQAEASLGASKRIELRLTQVSVDGKSYPLSGVGYGLEGGRRVPGLSAQFRDEAPALAADALRGALRGISRYVDLANQSGNTTVSGGVVVHQPSAPDLLSNVAGSLAELLAVPAGERALVRIARVPQGTPLHLLVQSLGEPSR